MKWHNCVREEPLTQPAHWAWRQPIIRHVRYYVNLYRVNSWYATWNSVGYLETHDFDRRCLNQIWRGII
jgi:hypothetical protein